MRRTSGCLAGLVWLFLLAPSRADQPHAHLAPCDWPGLKADCEGQQRTFVRNFSKAYRGDYEAQRAVAFCLQDGCTGGVRRNPILACAWRLVIATSGSPSVDSTDAAAVRLTCGHLDEIEREAAKLQAKRLVRLILRRP